MIFFAYSMFYWIFILTPIIIVIQILIYIIFSTIKFAPTITWNMFFFSMSFFKLFVIILDTIRFTSSILFGTHILLYIIWNTRSKSSKVLQLQLYLPKLIINGYWCENILFVAIDPLKLDETISTCLTNPNIALYCSLSLNCHEC